MCILDWVPDWRPAEYQNYLKAKVWNKNIEQKYPSLYLSSSGRGWLGNQNMIFLN